MMTLLSFNTFVTGLCNMFQNHTILKGTILYCQAVNSLLLINLYSLMVVDCKMCRYVSFLTVWALLLRVALTCMQGSAAIIYLSMLKNEAQAFSVRELINISLWIYQCERDAAFVDFKSVQDFISLILSNVLSEEQTYVDHLLHIIWVCLNDLDIADQIKVCLSWFRWF